MIPELDTYNRKIREKIGQILAALEPLGDDDLNRAPGLPGANTPFVIATHTFGNLRAWVLGIAAGQDLSRDRPAEFASRGSYKELRAAGEALAAEIEAALRGIDPVRLDDRFVPAADLWGEGEAHEIMRRDALAHTLEHAGIHLGHIHITAQLLAKERAG